jgi:hypothetical protein
MAALALAVLLAAPASAQLPGVYATPAPAALKDEPRCVLHALAGHLAFVLGRHRGPEFELALRTAATGGDLPRVRLMSATPLADFRRALERQYLDAGSPDAARQARSLPFSNLYAVSSNEVFLIDDPAYYARLGGGRTAEDSLAHEYMHFIQVRYYGYSVKDLAHEAPESQAVEYQGWYRDEYSRPGRRAPCP